MNPSIFAQPPVVTVTPKVGDVLVGSYGYEASIATFALVMAVSSRTVRVRELDQRHEYKNGGGMYWTAFPLRNSEIGKVMTKRFTCSERGYSIKWSSYQKLHGPWKGTSVECNNVH